MSYDEPSPSDVPPPEGERTPAGGPPPEGEATPAGGPPPEGEPTPAGGPPPQGPPQDQPPQAPPPQAPPPQEAPPAGAQYAGGPYPGGAYPVRGVVPESVGGPFYNPWLVILLTIVTCGIWGAIWTYRTSEDLKKYNGDGLGGVLGVVIYVLLSVVLMFTIPNEVEKMYQRDGRESPVNALWGLWFLLPIIGNIIWYLKVQSALNEFWLAKGARPE